MSVWVYKFGGTSVGSVEALRLAMQHVKGTKQRLCVVVSAMSGITDLLLDGARAAAEGDLSKADDCVRAFTDRHTSTAEQLLTSREALDDIRTLVTQSADELTAIFRSIAVLKELSTRTLDATAARGERVLAQMFTFALNERAVKAEYVDAQQLIVTEMKHGSLWPVMPKTKRAVDHLVRPLLEKKKVVIVPGFIGRGPGGEVVTLGRGGSDFSAALMAASIGAERVTLYKEVDGLMTADPRRVPEARVVPEMHYREAAELAYYGAKVLHPRTMIPLIEQRIPLYLKNTFNAGFSGTRIGGDVEAGAYPVKALTAILDQALVSVEGNGMMGVPGIAGRTFTALSQGGHSVSMISQASSESSICFVLPDAEADHARAALKREFVMEMQAGLVDAVRVEKGLALIAVVGLGMRGAPGTAARTFSAMSAEKINIVAIAQGSSELNITLVIKDKDVSRALVQLHREFKLDKLRPLADSTGNEASLALWGTGQIGRALIRQIAAQETYFRHDLGVQMRCVALADRSGMLVNEKGFAKAALLEAVAQKEKGKKLGKKGELWTHAFRKPVFVDLTAEETTPLLMKALEHDFNVVVANKKPLAVAQERFDALMALAKERRLHVRYEATVGAGLPVLDTFAKLKEAGDKVQTVLGCLSGTLGYLMSQLEQGVTFSEAVRMAHTLGYTEPDPRDDLSGMDVGRKALILARTLGMRLDLGDVAVEALFPPALSVDEPNAFMRGLSALDAVYAGRIAAARKKGEVIRYVARIGKNGVKVGLESVKESSPMGRLKGTDNQIVLQTKRYAMNPLVVTGPGAGAEVTAAGVLNDIVAIAKAS